MLDHQADLMVRLNDPEVRQVWTSHITMMQHDANIHVLTEDRRRSNAAAMLVSLDHTVPNCVCFHVSEEMSKLVTFMSMQLDETDRVDTRLLPSQCGLVRFEGGLPVIDVRGNTLLLSWAAWGPIKVFDITRPELPPVDQTMLYFWNDWVDEPDDIAMEMRDSENGFDIDYILRVAGRWGFQGIQQVREHTKLGAATLPPSDGKTEHILADGGLPVNSTNTLRLMHAFWLMLGQTVTSRTDADIPRQVRKRADRRKLPPRVVVIQLRNLEHSARGEGESLVQWGHRWLVRAHPRWQVCGPNHPLAQEIEPGKWRARIWIWPYVKGPSDKPLIIPEKVYALHR
jgi:hypothetical protein